jgi:hypothetical protein
MTRRETSTPGTRAGWFKSSFSASNSSCVEVRFDRAAVQVRDSKDVLPGPLLKFGTPSWAAFLRDLRG